MMLDPDLRDVILAAPEKLLEDRDVMAALVGVDAAQAGANVFDLRTIAMQKLEERLDKLEETHRSVIAAAYENLAGTNQIHRAILEVLEPVTFDDFLAALPAQVAQALRVDAAVLVLETAQTQTTLTQSQGLRMLPAGSVAQYLTAGRNVPLRPVLLRQCMPDSAVIYGEASAWVRSEALLRLDFGAGRLPGLLALGSEDPHHFKPNHGTDLLGFFGSVFERAMRRWLG
jgi:uncharacterized protein YigA (DUF484 family)